MGFLESWDNGDIGDMDGLVNRHCEELPNENSMIEVIMIDLQTFADIN